MRAWPAAGERPNTTAGDQPPDVLVEAFGCDIPETFLAWCAQAPAFPVWINLEYLSAEAYVARCHGLPSPVMAGPAAGRSKWFFYPGFTAGTGGLLREPGLAARRAGFDRTAARATQGARPDELRVTLFCYEPPALPELLDRLASGTRPARLAALPGRPAQAVQALAAGAAREALAGVAGTSLAIDYPAPRPQPGFDAWLWAADLNFVRGEDSLVRALWAGVPFVWQIYPQDDGAHAAKLDAFLDWLQAPPGLRHFHHVWNGLAPGPLPIWDLPAWGAVAMAARTRLEAQADLTTQLLGFAAEKR